MFYKTSRLVLGVTQHSIQWMLDPLFLVLKQQGPESDPHLHLGPRLRIRGTTTKNACGTGSVYVQEYNKQGKTKEWTLVSSKNNAI